MRQKWQKVTADFEWATEKDQDCRTYFLVVIRFGETHVAAYLCPLKKLYHKYGKIRAALKIKEL